MISGKPRRTQENPGEIPEAMFKQESGHFAKCCREVKSNEERELTDRAAILKGNMLSLTTLREQS